MHGESCDITGFDNEESALAIVSRLIIAQTSPECLRKLTATLKVTVEKNATHQDNSQFHAHCLIQVPTQCLLQDPEFC